MDYCLVISVGYAVTVLTLWEAFAGLWALVEPSVISYALYGPLIAIMVFVVGSIVNCTFQALGSAFSLSPSVAIGIGWSLISLTLFVMAILPHPPSSVQDFAKAVLGGAQALTNSFPASKIFYDIGNFTLALVGVK